MSPCPYCGVRKIAITLHEATGHYSMCRPCYMQFEGLGLTTDNEKSERGIQMRLLEWWWTLPSVGGR